MGHGCLEADFGGAVLNGSAFLFGLLPPTPHWP